MLRLCLSKQDLGKQGGCIQVRERGGRLQISTHTPIHLAAMLHGWVEEEMEFLEWLLSFFLDIQLTLKESGTHSICGEKDGASGRHRGGACFLFSCCPSNLALHPRVSRHVILGQSWSAFMFQVHSLYKWTHTSMYQTRARSQPQKLASRRCTNPSVPGFYWKALVSKGKKK